MQSIILGKRKTFQIFVLKTKFYFPEGTEKLPPFCKGAGDLPTDFDCQEAQD